ncbi:MAG: phage tail protein [Rhizobiales bacterium]|nr:phage tail protein [Hyphomicrobiales bacterium]
MFDIDVLPIIQTQQKLDGLKQALKEKIIYQSIQQIGSVARTATVRNLVKETTLKHGYLTHKIKGHMLGKITPVYIISIGDNHNDRSSNHTLLSRFKFKASKGGVTANVWGDKGKMHKGAFVLNLKNGNQGIFKRIKGQRTSSGKQKLKMLYGPSLQREAFRGNSAQIIYNIVADKLPQRISNKVDQYLKKIS